MRHTWNTNNTLTQWQERFQEDMHSMMVPIAFELQGTRFAVCDREELIAAGPLPEAVQAILPQISHPGCRRFEWPACLEGSAGSAVRK